MFKRFLVTDLFHHKEKYGGNGWKNVSQELPKNSSGIFNVKLSDESKTLAYYYEDKIANLTRYFKEKPSHWWDKNNKTPIHNVVEWEDNLNDDSLN